MGDLGEEGYPFFLFFHRNFSAKSTFGKYPNDPIHRGKKGQGRVPKITQKLS